MPSTAAPIRVGLGASAIPFRRLVRVEWRKATDTRAARWLLLITAVVTAGLMLIPLLARHSVDQNYTTYLAHAALGLTILLPVVSILTLTSEWTQRTVLTTFTQEPRRARVTNAKVTVSLLLALLGAIYGAIVTVAAIGLAAASGRHVEANLTAGTTIGFVVFVLLNVLMGVALGALLHHTAAAVVLLFALPTALGFLGTAVNWIDHWLDPSTTFDWVMKGEWGGHTAEIAVSTLVWLVIPLAAGLIRTTRREIK